MKTIWIKNNKPFIILIEEKTRSTVFPFVDGKPDITNAACYLDKEEARTVCKYVAEQVGAKKATG